jgi:hypothetical protein
MSLSQPSRTIVVEPVKASKTAPEPVPQPVAPSAPPQTPAKA